MSVLVTGGAGYIGSHVVAQLVANGQFPVIVDDFSTGYKSRVASHTFYDIDISEKGNVSQLASIMRVHEVESVIHLAAKKNVAESVALPLWYFEQNIGGIHNLLAAMLEASVRKIVFSSSAAVYGETGLNPVRESDPTIPINPYGQTKLVGEWLVRDLALAGEISGISLRYFNVAGAFDAESSDRFVQNLIPLAFEKISGGNAPQIYGTNYPTPDGTCIRDFIHVIDLAIAHVKVLDYLDSSQPGFYSCFNVGTGSGTSVQEIIELVKKSMGSLVEPEYLDRRAGDPASVTADVEKISSTIGWEAEFSIEDMIESTIAFQRLNE